MAGFVDVMEDEGEQKKEEGPDVALAAAALTQWTP